MRVLLVITCVTLNKACTTSSQYKPAVIVKPDFKDHINAFDLKVESFTDMIERNKIFIDHSLFIKECLLEPKSLYILGPRKSAKTINLHMLKTFLEIQVNNQGYKITPKNSTRNYKLFVNGEITTNDGTSKILRNPLLISKETELIQKHLGEYPVVYITFKDIKGENAQEVKQNIGKVIKRAYQNHIYLSRAFENSTKDSDGYIDDIFDKHLETFEEVLGNKMKVENLGYYIQDLCQMLKDHFKRKSIIIYDDYDAPLTNIASAENFPTKDVAEISAILEDIIISSIGMNKYCHKAYVMVTFELHQSSFSSWHMYKRVDLILNYTNPISQYFVLNEEIVHSLFNLHKIPARLCQRAYKWYKGFQSNRFNIYSIANFLNSKYVSNYFKDSEFERIVPPMMDINTDIRNTLTSLISNRPLMTTFDDAQTKISTATMYKLKPQTQNVREANRYLYEYDALFTFNLYLIRKGYLSAHLQNDNTHSINDTDLIVQFNVANVEIKTLMCSWLIYYYQRTYHIDDDALQKAATSLLQFVQNHASSLTLGSHLEDLYNQSSRLLESLNVTEHRKVEYLLNIVFASVALKMHNLTEFEIDVIHPEATRRSSYDRSSNLNYVISDNSSSQGMILQLNYNQPVHYTIELMREHESIRTMLGNLKHLKRVKLVAVNVRRNKTVEIHVATTE